MTGNWTVVTLVSGRRNVDHRVRLQTRVSDLIEVRVTVRKSLLMFSVRVRVRVQVC